MFAGTTHVVFAALQESSDLVSGWRDTEVIEHNVALFRNALGPLAESCASSLQHESLLQGAKAYGFHVGRSPVPGKERAPRDDHDNFYFQQEDELLALADGAPWSWTVFRPQVVYGLSFRSPMNLVPVLGVYAALERAAGRALSFPGGADGVHEAVDAHLLARALVWAADAPAACSGRACDSSVMPSSSRACTWSRSSRALSSSATSRASRSARPRLR